MRMLIAEDEHFVRERMEQGIAWDEHGIEVVDAVGNGRAAMEILQKEHLDLVLTDIRMPDMNGLELARELHQRFSHIKIIILTGYDDFEYARESIDYKVYKYLVKPVTNELLLEAVLELKKLHETELWERHQLTLLEQRWQEQLPHLRESMYKNWLNGQYALWELEKRCRDLNISIKQGPLWPLVFDMDPIQAGNTRFHEQDRPLVQFSLLTIAREVFMELDPIILQDDDGMTVVILFGSHTQEESGSWQSQAHQHIQTLLATVKDCLKLTASVGLGPVTDDALMLPHAYKQSKQALQERIVLGNETIVQFRDPSSFNASLMFVQDIEKELEMAIETGNEASITALTEKIIESRFANGASAMEAKEAIFRMVCFLGKIVHSHGWFMSDALGKDYARFEQYPSLLTKEQVLEWFRQLSFSISSTIAQRKQTGTQLMLKEIVQFIHEHIHEEELSLYLVADRLYVNYSYLSRIFKKLIGESFSEYVLKLRMEKAKELLANGQLVYDTAAQVGFRHVNYFSKVFMKYWGVKPSEIKH